MNHGHKEDRHQHKDLFKDYMPLFEATRAAHNLNEAPQGIRAFFDEFTENIEDLMLAYEEDDVVAQSELVDSIERLATVLQEHNTKYTPLASLLRLEGVTGRQENQEALEGLDAVADHMSKCTEDRDLGIVCTNDAVTHQYDGIILYKNLVFLAQGDTRVTCVGATSYKKRKHFKLSAWSEELQHDSYQMATSCVFPNTSSSSPSMAVHQTVSILLMRMLEGVRVQFEHRGSLQPDLIVDSDNVSFNFDVTSSNVQAKIGDLTRRYPGLNHVVIDKYRIFSCCNHRYDDVLYLSHRNERVSTKLIRRAIRAQEKNCNYKSKVSPKLLAFFSSLRDGKNRGMMEHYEALSNIMIDKYRSELEQMGDAEDQEFHDTEMMQYIRSEFNEALAGKYDNYLDRDAHCFPNIYSEAEVMTANYAETVRADYELGGGTGSLVVDNGTLMRACLDQEDGDLDEPAFSTVDQIGLPPKAVEALRTYALEKKGRDLKNAEITNALIKAYTRTSTTYGYIYSMVSRIVQHSNYAIIGGVLCLKNKSYRRDGQVRAEAFMPSPVYQYRMEVSKDAIRLDPDHLIILMRYKCLRAITVLASLRSYHDLQFKARVAKFIIDFYKAKTCFRVYHHLNRLKYAEVMIRGKILEKDQGVAYVSYYYDGKLYRSEKWRLPDVENYFVGHHRLFALAAALDIRLTHSKKLDLKDYRFMISTYAALIKDNSWGLSKMLKAFRFLSHGMVVANPNIPECCSKVTKELSKLGKKHTVWLMASAINSRSIPGSGWTRKPRSTIMFNLPYDLITYEIFLVNLCPNQIYGKFKHLNDVMKDTLDELDLYDDNEESIRKLWSDFENVIDADNLTEAYREYMEKIENLSLATDGRFTSSPLCAVMLFRQIHSVKDQLCRVQHSLPSLAEILTAKASLSEETQSPCLAAVGISELAQKHGSNSTSQLLWSIISQKKRIQLSMRMFEKDQTGGNREISILSPSYRILVIAAEYYYREFNKLLPNEYLHKPHKVKDLVDRCTTVFKGSAGIFFSLDQTRWGPNHSVSNFGLMTLMMMTFTTEAYCPAISCLLAEFKLFEIPPWIYGQIGRAKHFDGLIGRLGPGHMGQGIFHATSSAYHALVSSEILDIHKVIMSSTITMIPGRQFHYQSSMVTSDDCTFFECLIDTETLGSGLKDNGPVGERANKFLRTAKKLYSLYPKNIKFFGLKTSTYKNILSTEEVEFNSIYVSRRGYIMNDAKFCYSLVEPITTGVYYHDYCNALNSYHTATNSGCSVPAAKMIALANFCRFLRQWKMDMRITGFPSDRLLEKGMPPLMYTNHGKKCPDQWIENESYLRHKMRELPKDLLGKFSSNVQELLINRNLELLQGSRSMSAHRSCKTHFKGEPLVRTLSEPMCNAGIMRQTFEAVISQLNQDIGNLNLIVNRRYQVPYNMSTTICVDRDDPFSPMMVRKAHSDKLDIWRVVVSSYPRVGHIDDDHKDYTSLVLHFLRDKWTGESKASFPELSDISGVLNRFDYVKGIKDQIYFRDGATFAMVDSQMPRRATYALVEISMPERSVRFEFKVSAFCPYTIPTDLSNYKPGAVYLSEFKAVEAGRLLEVTARFGTPLTGFTGTQQAIPWPDLDECVRYMGRDAYEVNDNYCKAKGIKEMYLLLDMDRQDLNDELSSLDTERVSSYPEITADMTDREKLLAMSAIIGDDFEDLAEPTPLEELAGAVLAQEDLGRPRATVCFPVHVSASFMVESYFRRRLYSNAMLHKLHEHGALVIENSTAFLFKGLDSGSTRIFGFTRGLAEKVNTCNASTMATLSYGFHDWTYDYRSMCTRLILMNSLFSERTGTFSHPKEMLKLHPFVRFSTKPRGTVINDRNVQLFERLYNKLSDVQSKFSEGRPFEEI